MSVRFSILFVLFLALFSFTLQLSAFAVPVTGMATVAEKPFAGVEVVAYPADSPSLAGPPPHRSTPTTDDGLFDLDLPPGQYYLLARGEGYYTYYGRNPVGVPRGGLKGVNLMMVPEENPLPERKTQMEQGVVGRITKDGKPVTGAQVRGYTDLSSQLKGMGQSWSGPSDKDGIFEVPLKPGSHYLVVRLRQNGAMAGPLRAGDLFGMLPDNPLTIEKGKVARVAIPLIEVPEKVERYADNLFGETSISGRIVDVNGQAVAGIRVMLYADQMMLARPLYVSQPSADDGRFVLSFPRGGTYYLAARSKIGGMPGPGEYYGRYEGTRDASIRIRSGQDKKNLTILVEALD